jgi:hypothetical protein
MYGLLRFADKRLERYIHLVKFAECVIITYSIEIIELEEWIILLGD